MATLRFTVDHVYDSSLLENNKGNEQHHLMPIFFLTRRGGASFGVDQL